MGAEDRDVGYVWILSSSAGSARSSEDVNKLRVKSVGC